MQPPTDPTITEGEPSDANSVRVELTHDGDEWIPAFRVSVGHTEGVSDVLEPWLRDRFDVPETLAEAKADDRVYVADRSAFTTGLGRASFIDDIAIAEYCDEDKEWIVKILD